MSDDKVRHDGVVTRVDDKTIEVEIVSASACASCHIKSACGMGEQKIKTIVLPKPKDKDFVPMQKVVITMEASQGNKAALIAYFVPFVLLIATLLLLLSLGVNEGVAAIVSIVVLIPFYLVLYVMRKKVEKKFSYEIE